jgi:hypothetical protein
VLLEPGDRPLEHVALPLAHRIQLWWPTAPGASPEPGGLLVGPLGDGVGDPALARQAPAGGVAVAAVGGQVGGALAGSAQSTWARHPDAVQQRLKLGALMPLAGSDQHP